MADFPSTTYTAQIGKSNTLDANYSFRNLQKTLQYASIDVTLDGTEANAGNLQLGYLGVPGATLIPTLCRVSEVGAGGDITSEFTLESVSPAQTPVVTALTGVAACANNSVAFAALAAGASVAIAADEYIQATLSTATATTAGVVLRFELVYVTENY